MSLLLALRVSLKEMEGIERGTITSIARNLYPHNIFTYVSNDTDNFETLLFSTMGDNATKELTPIPYTDLAVFVGEYGREYQIKNIQIKKSNGFYRYRNIKINNYQIVFNIGE